jgi:nucleotide-binding universal stress UspA family protein
VTVVEALSPAAGRTRSHASSRWGRHLTLSPGLRTRKGSVGDVAGDPSVPETGHVDGYRRAMASPLLLCTDGSDEALAALVTGVDLLGRDRDLVLVYVMDGPDEASLAGSGHAGPELSLEEYDDQLAKARVAATSAVEKAQSELRLTGSEVRVLSGEPGPAICQLAGELSARAIVMGSRGRGGLKRAFLGSVSDHVVRNAPCSVVVTRT